jgi:hypothetical protein
MVVIPATLEAEVGRSRPKTSLGKNGKFYEK